MEVQGANADYHVDMASENYIQQMFRPPPKAAAEEKAPQTNGMQALAIQHYLPLVRLMCADGSVCYTNTNATTRNSV